MVEKTNTLAGFDPSSGVDQNDLIYMMKNGVEVKASASQLAAYVNTDPSAGSAVPADPLAGANIDGGQVGVTPAIVYQLLSIDGGKP